ncbi:zinc finger protein 862-like [Festucalex cinctus]
MPKKQQTLSSFFGVEPPKKKQTIDPEPKRAFSEKWLQEVPWLDANNERTEMWCNICRAHPHLADKTGAFFKGSKNFSHPLFDKHEKSKEHTNIAQAIANQQASREEIASRPLARWRDRLNDEQRQALCNIFLLAFHKAKHARPMSSYSEDIHLLKRLGVDVGSAYHSREGGMRIVQSIAQTISGELRAKLQSSEFWGLLFDGSEDITKTEHEIVYIVSVSTDGDFSSDFLGLIELGADRTAQAITNGLVKLFQDAGLDDWRGKLVAVCTDGAAVNVGAYNGVVPKLKQLVAVGSSLVHILCTAHTLENCAKSADQSVPYCETFNRCLIKLLQFYLQKGGAKNTATLRKMCQENGISFVKLGKFHNIRWSAWRHETLLKISRLLPAIKMQLATSDTREFQHICTERFQCFLANMLDIGNILKTTSLRFQKEKMTIGECKDELMVAIGQFTLLLDSKGHHRTHAVSNTDADRDKSNLLRGLIEEFESRYNSLKSCDHFLVFDPTTWPQEMQDLHRFGNTTVQSILQKYEVILQLDSEMTVREWMHLKQTGKRLGASSVYDLVRIVNSSNLDMYPNINKLIKLSLTLPLSSAACERGFSHLNIIKTKYRSRLSHARLTALMQIHLSRKTTVTYDPKPAVDLWMDTANRRLNQGQVAASTSTSSSYTMLETDEADDSGGDTEEDIEEDSS